MDEVGEHGSLLWAESNSWAFSNSDNSGGSEEKSGGKKLINSSSNSPTAVEASKEVVATVGKKRGRGGSGGGINKGGKRGGGQVNEGEGKSGGGGGESDHEMHIWTERERRKKMRNMFANLHALLPQLPSKADKSTIVDEAVNYIKTLQTTLQKLQKQKMERLQTATTTINNHDPFLMIQRKLAYDSSSREAFLADQGSSNNLASITPAASTSSNTVIPVVPSSRLPVVFQTWTSQNVVLNICGNEAHFSVCSTKKPGLLTAICYVLEKHNLEVVSAQVSSDYNRCMYMIQAHASNGVTDQYPEAFPMEEIFKQAAGEIMFWVSSC